MQFFKVLTFSVFAAMAAAAALPAPEAAPAPAPVAEPGFGEKLMTILRSILWEALKGDADIFSPDDNDDNDDDN
ncbi:uncharacterized protein N7484_009153 [Penicillium longicatenatum]|uniref:uncharacterized protein n=1 Tax=Penicillium longicatenatum TaxID=1561947 RepID=UPI002549C0FF|nr:uncharacterized protein N7484_009153 [Penicillium longicatenatum]KAJ5635840.1 hypothetical protein N7484_009153 [Penicillium longicatenatum]